MRVARRRRGRVVLASPPPDPFGEHKRLTFRKRLQLLGGRFEFESNSLRLLQLARHAYEGLPPHQLVDGAQRLRLSLLLTSRAPQQRSLGATFGT